MQRDSLTVPASRSTGFTLIEIAVALFIITLVLGSLLVPLGTQVEQRQIADTQKTLDEIREALMGFAVANSRLPCPDKTTGANSNDGLEDAGCAVSEGNVPWNTLGVAATDVWGNRFRYRVTAAFTTTFTLGSNGNLTVRCPTPACSTATIYTSGAPAVILSHGKNGYGAINASTGVANLAPTSANELENTNNDNTFYSRPPGTLDSSSGEFDDIVTWLSPNLLFNRMVAAGKLP
jgi:type II secretory pathway pseudopilin PulG